MKQLLIFAILLFVLFIHPVSAQRLRQPLDRGVVAVYRSGGRSVTSSGGTGSLISWRKLAQEPEGTTYNVYKRAQGTTQFKQYRVCRDRYHSRGRRGPDEQAFPLQDSAVGQCVAEH